MKPILPFIAFLMISPALGQTIPPAADAAGFKTLALNSDFSVAQPSGGWFGCLGSSGPGATWYQGREGGDQNTQVPCNANLSTGRFTLVQDATIGKQVFDLTFLPSDIATGRHYTTIQTVDDIAQGPPNCCQHGVVFPSNYYMEATYRIKTTPDVPKAKIGGVWWAFWQGGEGTPPGSRWPTLEVDHPEQHGEWPELLDWAVVNWMNGGGGYFPYSDVDSGLDATVYHTFGVRSTTDGNSIALCSYVDNVQRGCNSFSLASGQYSERKFPILFVGYQCYYFPSVSSNCINIPISRIYKCKGRQAPQFCVQAASKVTEQNYWPVQMNISGVSGASAINGSWSAMPIAWSKGATDWVLTGSTFNGTPTGGTINATTQVDLLISSVRVWSCPSWAIGPCYTTVLKQ